MIIGPNFIYAHVPKTSGSSFEKMMWERYGFQVFKEQHLTAAGTKHFHRNRFLFGFMRNPVMADVSEWRYCKLSWKNNDDFTYENWCKWRYGGESEEFAKKFLDRQDDIKYGYRFNMGPQAGYYCDEEGKCIASWIYRFENHAWAMDDISRRLELDCSIDDYRIMTYGHSRGQEDYWTHVTDTTLELLKKAKKQDFDLLEGEDEIKRDYTFDGNIEKLTEDYYGNYCDR